MNEANARIHQFRRSAESTIEGATSIAATIASIIFYLLCPCGLQLKRGRAVHVTAGSQ
jgi:hypothetical protein